MDKYLEQLNPVYKSSLYQVYTILMVISITSCFITLQFNFIISIACVGLAVLFFFLKQKQYVEYEYIFTNGDVDIDVIMEQKKRKKVINFDMNDIYIMAPLGSIALDGAPKGKKIIAYGKNSEEKVFVVILNKDNEVKEIHFTPNLQFLSLCFRSNPKNVKKS